MIEAKEKCGHGNWKKWLEENVEVTDRQARNYMLLARHWSKLEVTSDLGLEEALKKVANELPDNPTSKDLQKQIKKLERKLARLEDKEATEHSKTGSKASTRTTPKSGRESTRSCAAIRGEPSPSWGAC